jgi:uncharacterized membrane protein
MISVTHLHPMVVHFPIALIIVGFLADFLGLILKKEAWLVKAGFWLMMLGFLAALVAFGTGYFFTSAMEGDPGIVRERHETFAILTLISITLSVIFRIVIVALRKEGSGLKYISVGLYFLAFAFVSITGYIGGSLVMDYLIGM